MKLLHEIFEPKTSTDPINPQLLRDESINEKYLKGEIRIVTEQARYPLDSIPALLDSGKYNLNPEYQRRKRWNRVQKSKLIESFIINVPIPPIFLYEIEYAQYEVMDGLQRLTTIDDFYNGRFALTGLEEWKELNGKTYFDLPSKIKEGIDRRYISSIVLLNETAKNIEQAEFLKKIVFGRLNTGGDKLTAQENRNAIYQGAFNDLCIELSKNNYFRRLWKFPLYIFDNGTLINEADLHKSVQYREMEDVELVLRFFAFRHVDKFSSFASLEKFFDEYLEQANLFPSTTISDLKLIFEETIQLVFEIFGDEAFFMPPGQRKRTTPTTTIYDPMMQAISMHLTSVPKLIAKKDIIKEKLYQDKERLILKGKDKNNELFDGKYSSKNDVKNRIKYFEELINEVIS